MRSAKTPQRPRLFGIIGYPLRQTWSPDIHNAAFRACGQAHWYVPFALPPGALKRGVDALAKLGVRGFNVTVPHKETILPLLRSASALARTLGAVNTVVRTPRGWHGENTDVHGFAAALHKHRRALAGKSVVVLGTGGAARAVVYALIRHFDVTGVLVIGRNRNRRERTVRWALGLSNSVAVSGLALTRTRDWRSAFKQAALVVNATPVGGDGKGRLLPAGFRFRKGQIAFDLIYTRDTDFLKAARRQGAVALDGKAMLLEQAEVAFRLFTGGPFPKSKVLRDLKRRRSWQTG